MSVSTSDEEEVGAALIGKVLANRYQFESRIGEGAMGSVFKAKHVKVGRPFAVKVLHKRLLEDRKGLLRFEREAELAGRLHHPNVVGVVDVGETDDGSRYIVMDFAEGSDLATLLDDAPMLPERIINLTRQILEGLYHAHEQGLIHRDFKPENVIIERDDHDTEVPRIVDFGIAILREGGEGSNAAGRLTTNGLVLGTPHYMAPEQALADPIDHRIDLFALGIVIYEMLCGRPPFDGTGAEVARANLLLDPPPIAQRVPYLEVDPLLEAFSRRLMAKKREMRPRTAKVARELLDLISSDRASAAAALGVPVEAASARAPTITQPVSPHREATAEDAERWPVASKTPIPPTPALYGRAPTPHPFAGGDPVEPSPRVATPLPVGLEAPAYTPHSTPTEIEPRRSNKKDVRTDSAEPLAWEKSPRRSKRALVLAIGGAIAAAASIIIVATRGGSNKGDSSSTEPEQVVVRTTGPDMTQADPTPGPDTEAKPPAGGAEPKVDPQKVTDPIEIAPPVEPKKPEIKKPEIKKPEIKKPEIEKPDPTQPDPTVKPDVKPDLPDDLKMTKKPVIDAAGLYALYGAVGNEIAKATKAFGKEAVAPAMTNYRLVQKPRRPRRSARQRIACCSRFETSWRRSRSHEFASQVAR